MTDVHYEQTVERLQGYFPFADDIVEAVAEVAASQAGMDFGGFMNAFDIPAPSSEHVEGSKPIGVLYIPSETGQDQTVARARFLAHGNGLLGGNNQVFQIATAHVSAEAAGDGMQTYAFGNPGGIGHTEGQLSAKDAWKVARGDARPLIDAPLRYMASQGVTSLQVDGYSGGTVSAIAATEYAYLYDMEVEHVTNIDPADVAHRGRKLRALGSLAADFSSTAKALPGYVEANNLEAFIEARGDSFLGMANYLLGLVRPNNIARSSVMAGSWHESRAETALRYEEKARMHDVWASESELAMDGIMQAFSNYLHRQFPDRYSSTRLEGQKHTFVNDNALQSALLIHARRN